MMSCDWKGGQSLMIREKAAFVQGKTGNLLGCWSLWTLGSSVLDFLVGDLLYLVYYTTWI